jgi:GPH family glycoside/pentoside/hexuronide:cation symporter
MEPEATTPSEIPASRAAGAAVAAAASDRLPVYEKIGFGLGDTASNILYQAWSFFLAKFYTDVFGIPVAAASYLFLVTRFWDMIFDPIMGMIADRTSTRWGKFRPYILLMAVPYGILACAMFITPGWSQNARIIYAYVTYILATMAYTAVNIPYSSLMAVETGNPKERTTLSQYRFFFAFVGMLLITTFTLPLAKFFGNNPNHPGYSKELGYSQSLGYQMTMAVFGGIAIILLIITFLTTRERVVAPALSHGSTRQDLRELRRNVRHILIAVSCIAEVILLAVLAIGYGEVLLDVLNSYSDSTPVRIIVYVVTVGLVGLVVVGGLTAFWRAIQKTSFGNDISDVSRNAAWIVLFIASVFWLIHNMIRNGSVVYYFDYVNGGGKINLFTLHLGPFVLDFDQTTTFLTVGTLGMMAGVFLSTPCKKLLGKKPLMILLVLATVVIEAVFYVLPPSNFKLLAAFNFLWSIVAGAMPVFLFSMFADATDFHEWKYGRRATGLITSGIMFAIKMGVAVGGFLQLKLLGSFGYVANVAQTPGALRGIKLLLSVIPAAFIFVCGAVLLFYPINESRLAQMAQDLKARKSAQSA